MEPQTAGAFVVRPYRTGDAAELVRAARESVATVGRWMPWCHVGYVAAEADEWIAYALRCVTERSAYELAVVDARDDRLVGGVGLNQFNPRNNYCNLGYWVRETRQRQGAATAAARALARFGFDALRLTRIEIVMQRDNVASAHVAEAIGARYEGVARNRLVVGEHPVDAKVYGLVP